MLCRSVDPGGNERELRALRVTAHNARVALRSIGLI
jgi:hypothetical protein